MSAIEESRGALHFEGVRKVFRTRAGDVVALDGLTLHVPGGAIQAIAGASGAGKSTLFRCAATLERPDAGRVLLDGVDLAGLRGRALIAARRRIGTVFQTLNLLSSRTAAGNIALPLELEGRERGAIRARVAELLGWVGLGDRGGSYPSALSGGQRQRVAIARALAAAPSLLLCDEPTSALDPETAAVALELIQRARDELGVTVVIITHQLDVVRRVADRVAVIDAGRVVSEDVVVRAVAS